MADRPLFIRLNLPSGLEEALESLAREVLRQKPQNIYEFAADHFEELVKKRNECKYYFPSEYSFYHGINLGSIIFLYLVIILMHILIAEGVTSDDIFGIHTELKLPSSKIQSHLAIGDEDNTELESVSGKSKMYFKATIKLL